MRDLRPYQSALLTEIRAAFRTSKSAVVQLPTGGGKSLIMATIAQSADRKGNPTLVVVPSIEIFEQLRRDFAALGVPIATLAAGQRPDLSNACIVLAMSHTLRRRPDLGYTPRLIIVDELHKLLSQHLETIERWPDAYRLGFTATPIRTDGRALTPWSSTLVQGPSIHDLQRGGWLVPCTAHAGASPDLHGIPTLAGDYDPKQLQLAYQRANLVGDVAKLWLRLAKGRKTIAFASGVEASKELVDAYMAAGIRAEHVDGMTAPTLRNAALDRLRRGDIDVLCNCGLFIEGLDVPTVSCVTLCYATKSLAKYMQSVGRGLRPANGKTDLVILDHGGNCYRHWLPDTTRNWSLAGKIAQTTLAVAGLRTCKECLAMYEPAPLCPCCGYTPTPQERKAMQVLDVDLVKITQADLERQAIAKSKDTAERTPPPWLDASLHDSWKRFERERRDKGYALPDPRKPGTGFTECRISYKIKMLRGMAPQWGRV